MQKHRIRWNDFWRTWNRTGKMDYLAESLGPVQMRIMEGVKEVFDPKYDLKSR